MAQVDFYVLDTATVGARDEFVCRLVDKVRKQNHTVFIATANAEQTAFFDDLLWTFPPESFLPHSTTTTVAAPVVIGEPVDNPVTVDVYINLRLEPASQHAQQQRILEVVYQEPAVLAASRQHYKFYQQQGYPLKSHKLTV